MNKLLSYLIIYILTFSPYIHAASAVTITEPGTYPIVGNISYASTGAGDSIIFVNSSNVIVDLNGSVLTQSNGAAMAAGIQVASNAVNVKIKNGTIVAVQGSGISLSNNQRVSLEDIITVSCTTGISATNSSFVTMNNVSSLFATTGMSFSSFCNFIDANDLFIYNPSSDGLDIVQTSNSIFNNIAVSNTSGVGVSASSCSTLNFNNAVIHSCVTNGINVFNTTNCTINNCAVSNITGIGYSINNSSLIYLDNVTATSCTTIPYNLANISTCDILNAQAVDSSTSGSTVFNVNQCNSLNVKNCNFVRNGAGASPFNIMNIVGCTSSVFQDIILSCSTVSNAVNGVTLNGCGNDIFQNVNVINSFGAGLNGFSLSNNSTTSCLFDGCTLEFSNGNGGALMAFELNASNNNNVFRNCHSINNSGASARGWDVGSPTFNLIFDRCTIRNINTTTPTNFGFVLTGVTAASLTDVLVENLVATTGSSTGYFFSSCINNNVIRTISNNVISQGSTAIAFDIISSTSCHFVQCQAKNTSGTGGTGFIFNNCNSCNLLQSVIAETQATTGLALGIEFLSSNSCAAQDNTIIRSVGINPNNSIGFLTQSTVGNTYVRNSGLGSNSNFAGFVSNNFTNPNAGAATGNDTNTSTAPWTNFGLFGF